MAISKPESALVMGTRARTPDGLNRATRASPLRMAISKPESALVIGTRARTPGIVGAVHAPPAMRILSNNADPLSILLSNPVSE